MSQSSTSSEDSMTTSAPMKYIDLESLQQEEEEENEEYQLQTEPTTMVTQEELEVMIRCALRCIDNNKEILDILSQLNRTCVIQKKLK